MRYPCLVLALALPSLAQAAEPQPTAWTAQVQPLDAVARLVMPPVDELAYKDEDARHLADTSLKNLRFAASLKADLTPGTAGTWEQLDTGELLWRLRVYSKGARSLNFGFDRFWMPAGGRLFIYSSDGKHVHRPFTADDNEDHGQLWTPVVFGDETVLEVTLPESERDRLVLHLAAVNHDYRGFGRADMEKNTGACNIDVICPIGDPYNDLDRASAAVTVSGVDTCSGSLVNNTANDAKPFFMTAFHCGVDAGDAPAMVAYWNYYNSFCRPQGPGTVPPGDGQLTQFNTGAIFRAGASPTDFTLLELDDPLSPAFNLYLAGWDRTPNPTQFNATVAVHHPSVEEMRITFAPGMTESGGWPPSVPGDGSHIHAIWGTNLGVTEPGSSGSPLYTQQGRYIGQLHGGPSSCTAADKSDYYGRFSGSWTGGGTDSTRLSNWLDPVPTGAITLDGRNACTFPAAPAAVTATATALNTIQVTWATVPGATGYTVLRAVGPCPQTTYVPIATNVAGTSYDDTTVSGGTTYAYVVRSIVAGCPSLNSTCDDALATGACTLAPAFGGATSATSAGTPACAINVAWSAATATCGGTTVKYNVYRSTTAGTPPSPATLRASCLTTLDYSDTTVNGATRYYYTVRAEDSQAIGNGACNSGIQDGNLTERSAVPGSASVTVTDNVESGGNRWSTAGGSGPNAWAIVATQANSPTHSWFVADPDVVSDRRLATGSAGNIPAGFELSFFQRYVTEESGTSGAWDGHLLEYSLDGTTWVDILAGTGPIPANANRFTLNGYNRTFNASGNPLAGRRCWSGNQTSFQEVRVNMADFAGHDVLIRFRFGSDGSVDDEGVWIDDIRFRFPGACAPLQAAAPELLFMLSGAGDTVLRPNGPSVIMAPSWRNTGTAPITLTGTASNFTGPGPATYNIPDATAAYGTFPPNTVPNCATSTGDCYAVSVAATGRPSTHWDGTILETVSPTSETKTWTLHVGDSFGDVPSSNSFYRFIETILHNSVTGGCSATNYCPTASTTREAMAVFVLVSKEGAGYAPAACGPTPMFTDVPVTSGFCKWVEELARRGVVAGCAPGLYCPTASATREQMAVFVLRTLDGTLSPPACVAGSEEFDDVPASSGFCRWIEELFRRGVVTGCGGNNYCPAADVTREQMSVFLALTFGLSLYGL